MKKDKVRCAYCNTIHYIDDYLIDKKFWVFCTKKNIYAREICIRYETSNYKPLYIQWELSPYKTDEFGDFDCVNISWTKNGFTYVKKTYINDTMYYYACNVHVDKLSKIRNAKYILNQVKKQLLLQD